MGGLQVDAKAVDAVFAAFDNVREPGCSVGIAVDGVPVYRRGFGLASLELPVALTPSIRVRIGSTTKHFACLAFMLLVEEGKASPSDPVRKHMPELSSVADGITMAQLMQHVSGLRCALDLNLQFGGLGRTIPTEEGLALMAAQDSVNFAPGENWSYNNGGYALLSEVVDRLSGKKLAEFLDERIFKPVGMHDTMLRRFDTDLQPNCASLHLPTLTGGWNRGVFPAEVGGEGGMISTVDDMLRWLKHMDAPVVGSKATWDEMRKSAVLKNGHETGYGYGLITSTYRGTRVLHHAGGVIGGASQMLKALDHGLDIIILGNRPIDSMGLAERVLDAVLPDLEKAREKPAKAVSGTWINRKTGQVVQLIDKDGEQLLDAATMPLPTLANEDGSISSIMSLFDLRVRPLDDGTLETTEYGHTAKLEKLEGKDGDADAPTGAFASPASQLQVTIERDGDDVFMGSKTRYGSSRFQLTRLGNQVWKATNITGMPNLGGTLEFDSDGNSFLFTSGRTHRLKFVRDAA